MDDEAGFEAFVTERWPVLVRSAVLLGCSRAEAEDVAQTTLVRCYAAWSKVTAADNRDGYVYRMLVNAHRDSRRRRWWGEAPTEFVDRAADDGLEAVDGADVMRRALDRLSDGQRQVVVLRYYAQLSERETAEALGVPNGTVKSRLARALDALAADPGLAALTGGIA